jgi:hypothetical protein
MLETVLSIVPKANAIVVATVEQASAVSDGGRDWVRTRIVPSEVWKGSTSVGTPIQLDVAAAGKETPELREGREYVFFLKRPDGGPWHLVDLSRPLEVPERDRAEYLAIVRGYVPLAAAGSSEDALKRQLVRALGSGIPLLQLDAARTTDRITRWSEADLDELVAVLDEPDPRKVPRGTAREFVVVVLVTNATPERLQPIVRHELLAGDADAVYFGLEARKDDAGERVLRKLFDDPDEAVRAGALRVAGLLRRADLLDAYAAARKGRLTQRDGEAVVEARKLVTRD